MGSVLLQGLLCFDLLIAQGFGFVPAAAVIDTKPFRWVPPRPRSRRTR